MKDTRSIDERFADFHARHPEVYARFVEFAEKMRARGRTHYSADVLIGAVRFHTDAGGDSATEFKINDHYVSRYARLLMRERPEFAGFFETRRLKSAG